MKWGNYDRDVLPMWVADMDFMSPPAVLSALRERIDQGIFGYPLGIHHESQHNLEMRGVIVERLRHLYNWQVLPEELVFIPGVVTAFNMVCHMRATPGGAVLVQPPVYFPILDAAGNAGMLRQDAQLFPKANLHYEIDFDAFEAAITEQTRLFILCNPHNPLGRVFTRDELLRMAECCLDKHVLICSDEIHCDLIYSGQRHLPIASLDAEISKNTITLMAPSKTFNLPGLQFSFAVIQNEPLRKQFQKTGQGLVAWVNLLGRVAALAAYRDGQDWLDQLLVYLENNRDLLVDFVERELPGIKTTCPEGTYLAWLDCREASIPGSPFEFFLNQARLAFNDGKTFGSGGEGFVRLNFGCPRFRLVEALRRMKQALA